MNQDTLNIFLIIFLAVITGCIVIVSFFFIKALLTLMRLADDLSETAQSLKNKVQLKALAAIPAFLLALFGKFRKRG